MRYLAIDFGERRTGLAVGDDVTGVVTPTGVVERAAGDDLLRDLAEAIEAHGPDAVVVGLPVNMDGTEGPRAARVRALAAGLAALIAQPIRFQDERLTTFAADQHLARSGRTHKQKKAVRDALAAAEILRDHLDAKP